MLFAAKKIIAARFVATVSDYNLQHLRSLAANEHPSNIVRIYNGINLARFTPDSKPRKDNHFLSVGRLIEKKGFPDLLLACQLLKNRGCSFHCTIVGDGPDRDALASRIAQSGLQAHVTLAGSMTQEALLSTMRQCTAMVLPCVVSGSGDRDGLPTVLLEAMACAVPTITTTVSGGPEIVVDGITGHLVAPSDPAAIARAMHQILGDPSHAAQMGRNGRIRAEDRFDLGRNVEQLRQRFEQARFMAPAAAEVVE